jgi:predicted dehydrogenase
MGSAHSRWIKEDDNRDFCLGAVCDVVPAPARKIGQEMGVEHFTDAQAMYDSGLIDAVLIAVPHYAHPVLAIRAARAGLHVLCEKPLAVTVGPARAMIAQCRKNKVAFGAMLQQRTKGVYMKMKEMVDAGKLGEVFRVQMTCSAWYRTQAYYESGAWRGTWDGEGGGVLINQAPHSLDLFQWIGGMPRRVIATVGTRWHKIEVENTANAICEYGGGKTGYIYATTAEMPGLDQLMVCGEKGTLIAQDGKLRFGKLRTPIRKHMFSCKESFAKIGCDWQEVAWKKELGGKHIAVIRAFAAHVLRGSPMIATGAEAVNELELSNAIYLAGFKEQAVELPVNARQIDSLIARLEKERSSGKGQNLRARCAKELKKLLRS